VNVGQLIFLKTTTVSKSTKQSLNKSWRHFFYESI